MSSRLRPQSRLLLSSTPQCLHASTTLSLTARRTFFGLFGKKKSKSGNPVLDEFMKKAPSKQNPTIERGDLASSSIFDDDSNKTKRTDQRTDAKPERSGTDELEIGGEKRSVYNMATILDPRPHARERWQRKMVIRQIKKGGRLNKEDFLARTERESSTKSPNLKTSIKKLNPLARQIAGKTLEEAITQMRFSKKKVAREVLEHLEYARDRAIVSRGMGLGGVAPSEEGDEGNGAAAAPVFESKDIVLKDGKRHRVTDPSKMYIDQAYVGRGPYGKLPDYRARGRLFLMRTPWTHLTVKLKEEATRVREHEEREEKRERKRLNKVWVPLPDRPINGQRQYYSW
ncbi:hypothetical protein MBLNU457_1419t1 [Dothideomycetes sp. NU457]